MANNIYYVDIDGIQVPLKIIVEKRVSTRVALGGSHVILRVPKAFLLKTNVNQHVDWAKKWLLQLENDKPNRLDRYSPSKLYEDADVFSIGNNKFFLAISYKNAASGSIRLQKEGVLSISLPSEKGYDEQKLIKNLLIKFSQKYFLKAIQQKVTYYNDHYFKKEINSVRLKYNKSNWGSCSTGKNLNFSVRLFFAPDDVIDYVVIHELAHLIEMNHSPKFWKIVSDIMPDYEVKEKLLKINSAAYDF
jgi:predicted metal-dependent hydrolase